LVCGQSCTHTNDELPFRNGNYVGETYPSPSGQGDLALCNNGDSTNYKLGYWKEFDEKATLISEGTYKLGRYVNCCIDGFCYIHYNYKVGTWKYYNQQGSLIAEVKYEPKIFYIDTSCEDGEELTFGELTNIQLSSILETTPVDLDSLKLNFQDVRTIEYLPTKATNYHLEKGHDLNKIRQFLRTNIYGVQNGELTIRSEQNGL
jgi:hypothetical protein